MKELTHSQKATRSIYELAVRPQGIRQQEEYLIYKEFFGSSIDEETGYTKTNISASQKSYIRRKVREIAKERNQTALFVPDWVGTHNPRSSWEDILSITNNMYDRMQEYVNEYMYKHSLPSSARYAVEQQLFVLLVPGYSPRGIYDTTHLISETINALEKNIQNDIHKPDKPYVLPQHAEQVYKDLKKEEHFIY